MSAPRKYDAPLLPGPASPPSPRAIDPSSWLRGPHPPAPATMPAAPLIAATSLIAATQGPRRVAFIEARIAGLRRMAPAPVTWVNICDQSAGALDLLIAFRHDDPKNVT